jgi:acyl phosphate:glycerol-3-phosphate acyltransferase
VIETLALVPWESAWPYLLATFAVAYLVGSIPFGLIFAQLAGAGDVRKIGSGNIGATNVLRTGKRWAAGATLLCDLGKGAFAVWYAGRYFGMEVFPVVAGFAAFIGHIFPVWLKFRGGKGVATFLGVAIALDAREPHFPVVGILTCLSWVVTASAFRYSSLAALVAAAATPIYFLVVGASLFAGVSLLMALIVVFTHRANIARLLGGAESKIGGRRT